MLIVATKRRYCPKNLECILEVTRRAALFHVVLIPRPINWTSKDSNTEVAQPESNSRCCGHQIFDE
jgi:hypothetical protein